MDEEGGYGFVDPDDVVRACHLIPNYALGLFDPEDSSCTDYLRYYINSWVDRDMFCRYFGGGIGHSPIRWAIRFFEDTVRQLTGQDPVTADDNEPMDDSDLDDEPRPATPTDDLVDLNEDEAFGENVGDEDISDDKDIDDREEEMRQLEENDVDDADGDDVGDDEALGLAPP